MNKASLVVIFLSTLLLQACSNEETYSKFSTDISSSTPDQYFKFFNQHARLSAGKYTLIAETVASGVSADFTISYQLNGSNESKTIKGSWTNSAGLSSTPWSVCLTDTTNICNNLDIPNAKGFTATISSSVDVALSLVKDEPITLMKRENSYTNNTQEQMVFSESRLNERQYATAYYKAVDVGNARDTLQKYKALHGFDQKDVVHVTFRDSKDLGYGRDMYMRTYPNTECGGQVIAFYVRNFKVDVVKGFAYGLVNLEGAIDEDLQYHFGSNAIEFSKGFTSAGDTCSDQPMTRFFTYKSDYSSPNTDHPRLEMVDLDGRGEKAMPQPCISCHGGKARPLDRFNRFVTINANDSVNQIGDTKSRLQAFEVDTFEFSSKAGKTQANMEEGLRKLNSAVFCSYPGSLGHAACTDFGGGIASQTDDGEWNANFARDMLLGAYQNQLEIAGTKYQKGYVPSGWQPSTSGVPEGADTLFTKVISPNCFVCHGKRGSNLGSQRNANSEGKDIDFSSWDKFISHAEEVRRLVFEEGRMPLGLLNFNHFWDDKEKAALLASFISPNVSDFTKHVDANGNIIKPGKAVARAGLDRITKKDAPITLNGSSSLFVNSYSWSLISKPVGATATIDNSDQTVSYFKADTKGSYTVQLDVTNTETFNSDQDELIIVVDDTLAIEPRKLKFSDIKPVLNNVCYTCHAANGSRTDGLIAGIPMWWESDSSQPIAPPSSTVDSPALGLYEQVRARINFYDIPDSLILKKPSNIHHYGGVTALNDGFKSSSAVGSADRANYDMFINWIYEGAVCGVANSSECPNEE